jgi:hypothetical protein
MMSLCLIAVPFSRRAPPFTKAWISVHVPQIQRAQHHPHSIIHRNDNVRQFMAKPKRGSVVDSYQTVSVNCQKCGERLFRYKKKNGTKSNLVKCYVERICQDSAGLLQKYEEAYQEEAFPWHCPSCDTNFARSSRIHGRPALKIVGGKVRMTKK